MPLTAPDGTWFSRIGKTVPRTNVNAMETGRISNRIAKRYMHNARMCKGISDFISGISRYQKKKKTFCSYPKKLLRNLVCMKNWFLFQIHWWKLNFTNKIAKIMFIKKDIDIFIVFFMIFQELSNVVLIFSKCSVVYWRLSGYCHKMKYWRKKHEKYFNFY